MEDFVKTAWGMNGYRYPLITGLDYHCVPTCLEMIVKSMGYQISGRQLASYFHIVTNEESVDDNDLGVHIVNGELDKLFADLCIPVSEQYIPISQIAEFEFTDIISKHLSEQAHIICGYSYGLLFREQLLEDIGHVSIILSAEEENVKILNPGPKNAGVNLVREDDLYQSIRRKRDGLWILKKNNESSVVIPARHNGNSFISG